MGPGKSLCPAQGCLPALQGTVAPPKAPLDTCPFHTPTSTQSTGSEQRSGRTEPLLCPALPWQYQRDTVLQPWESWAETSPRDTATLPTALSRGDSLKATRPATLGSTWDTVSETKVQSIFRIKIYRENSSALAVAPAVEQPNTQKSLHLVPVLCPGMGSIPVTDWGWPCFPSAVHSGSVCYPKGRGRREGLDLFSALALSSRALLSPQSCVHRCCSAPAKPPHKPARAGKVTSMITYCTGG